jgi:hypothetical protein
MENALYDYIFYKLAGDVEFQILSCDPLPKRRERALCGKLSDHDPIFTKLSFLYPSRP